LTNIEIKSKYSCCEWSGTVLRMLLKL